MRICSCVHSLNIHLYLLRMRAQAIEMSDTPVPDMLCLCGRIYKDRYCEETPSDGDKQKHPDEVKREKMEALEKAIEW